MSSLYFVSPRAANKTPRHLRTFAAIKTFLVISSKTVAVRPIRPWTTRKKREKEGEKNNDKSIDFPCGVGARVLTGLKILAFSLAQINTQWERAALLADEKFAKNKFEGLMNIIIGY